jgi:hypothetical protein
MNSRERVLKAFKRMDGLPDRMPIQFDLCRQLADHFGKEMEITVHSTNNLFEDVTYRISANELRIAMGSDVVITGASVSDGFRHNIYSGRWYGSSKGSGCFSMGIRSTAAGSGAKYYRYQQTSLATSGTQGTQ